MDPYHGPNESLAKMIIIIIIIKWLPNEPTWKSLAAHLILQEQDLQLIRISCLIQWRGTRIFLWGASRGINAILRWQLSKNLPKMPDFGHFFSSDCGQGGHGASDWVEKCPLLPLMPPLVSGHAANMGSKISLFFFFFFFFFINDPYFFTHFGMQGIWMGQFFKIYAKLQQKCNFHNSFFFKWQEKAKIFWENLLVSDQFDWKYEWVTFFAEKLVYVWYILSNS